MAETKVQKKVSKLIQQELSEILQLKQVYMNGVMVTVSQVKVPADFSLSKVYVSVLPDSKLEELVGILNENSWEIRKSLAARIKNKIRKIPELQFYEDDSFKEADRISRLLDTLVEEDESKGASEDPESKDI
ncbi:MAG: 30S ribosome-binding factor RbfA [Bacteroidia bacterium]|nr:30S ribosome-binding factor RbfA [Bacteroidia bacterium]